MCEECRDIRIIWGDFVVHMIEQSLEEFNLENFVRAVSEVTGIDKNCLLVEVPVYIWPRLDFMYSCNENITYFIMEENYVETDWKDMISVHYINTSYQVSSTVMRVHIFLDREFNSNNYAGFFTLRKIDEVRFMLSYIYPNWEKLHEGKVNVMTYCKKIHIMGQSISFYTYPLFVQDNNVVTCAEANLISMSQYLHYKFDMSKIRIRDLENAYEYRKTKSFPSQGLNFMQMLEILNYYNIPVVCKHYKDFGGDNEVFREFIDSSVESALPVLLGLEIKEENEIVKRHVVQIIGHSSEFRREYVIYDDSGAFLKQFKKDGFVATIDWEKLTDFLNVSKSFFICPIHEKVYILYQEFRGIFNKMVSDLSFMKTLGIDKEDTKFRCLLADNRNVKNFLASQLKNFIKDDGLVVQEIGRILSVSMPHYLWLCEVELKDCFVIWIADPTYAKSTTRNIFINKIPIECSEQFGLLGYDKK